MAKCGDYTTEYNRSIKILNWLCNISGNNIMWSFAVPLVVLVTFDLIYERMNVHSLLLHGVALGKWCEYLCNCCIWTFLSLSYFSRTPTRGFSRLIRPLHGRLSGGDSLWMTWCRWSPCASRFAPTGATEWTGERGRCQSSLICAERRASSGTEKWKRLCGRTTGLFTIRCFDSSGQEEHRRR